MSLYQDTVPQLIKMLRNLESWLDEGVEYADSRSFDPEVLLQQRLYPDMYPLVRQIQAACDTAKFIGARLSGVDAPVNPDTETTLAEIRERIAGTLSFLESVDADAFDGDRVLKLAFLQGGSVTATDYLYEFAIPNFYFHLTNSYSLLRHNGVLLGKRKYMGSMNVKFPS